MPLTYDKNGYKGAVDNDDITYSSETTKGQISKVIARLTNYMSGRYTKLGRNLKRIEELNTEIETLKNEVKQDTRELLQDLFNAEDVAYTRSVETVGFIFQLTKDPAPSNPVSYSKVLKELEKHLTPELIKVLETIKAKHTGATQFKAPGLSYVDKGSMNEADEGFFTKIKSFFSKLLSTTEKWAASYDNRLDALKREVQITESLNEDTSLEDALSYALESVSKEMADAKETYYDNKDKHGSDAFDVTVKFYCEKIAKRAVSTISDLKHSGAERGIYNYLLKKKIVEDELDSLLAE